ncbi:MAG TPA: hypothetical protein VMH90_02465 [Thermoplasmata archaeon]|nr:hypothetical protein [Thermoplasmata archaeon]
MNWDMISFVFRALGFILIAVGVLLIAVVGQFPGSCYSTTSTCGSLSSSNISGMANAYMAGEVLMVLGALFLGLGAGIKLHWVLRAPADGSSDRMAWVLMERVFNYGIIAIALIVLWWTLTEVPILASFLKAWISAA